eukprot:snap_masked-scaffold_84-processed-gene-0.8-mRNA-1 protein AED:0.27 eAED:0.30 QI:340/1/0.8/1/0.25/0.2/5/0/175
MAEYTPTVLDNFLTEVEYRKNSTIMLDVWDTAGQEQYVHIRRLTYPGTDGCFYALVDLLGFIVCYSCKSKSSLDNIRSVWLPESLSDATSPDKDGVTKEPVFVIVGTKSDLVKSDDPQYIKLQEDAKRIVANQKGHEALVCSALENDGVSDVFKNVIQAAYTNKYGVPKKPCCLL